MKAIVSVDTNWGIGLEGRLLRRIPEDMKLFRERTIGKVVVMGRETFESLPGKKPLKDRVNIVLSRNADFNEDGVVTCRNFDSLLTELDNYPKEDVFIIGGASVYQQLLPFCSEAYVTKIEHSFVADSYFPNLDSDDSWKLVSTGELREFEDIRFRYTKYINKLRTVS